MKLCLVLCLCLCSCANWTVNGINISETEDKLTMVAGGLTSIAVHWLSHVAYLEANGIDWHQQGLMENIERPWELSDSERGWMGRSGFVGQLLIGTILKYSPWSKTPFVTGYHIGTAAEIWTYPVIPQNEGDIYWIGDTGYVEWGGYSLLGYLLLQGKETN